ncbi:MAG TPA: response regulator transcription factor [Halanaerobiales bacterium]|nr:response regulator transcription factor [Halanaerobiales bacterium]
MDLFGKKILVIEEDPHIFALIRAMLKPYDVKLVLRKDGIGGLETALEEDYNLVLLDIMLPKKDGWEVCRELKSSGKKTPIIMLTAKVEETDKVLGLEIGADDYVTKPFSPRELIARIKAVLRRYENTADSELDKEEKQLIFKKLEMTIDLNQYLLCIKENPVSLTLKEFELLVFLARHQDQVFTREQLLEQIWGFPDFPETRTVDEHIKRLRKKLSEAGLENPPLETVWGVGYKFSLEDELDEI